MCGFHIDEDIMHRLTRICGFFLWENKVNSCSKQLKLIRVYKFGVEFDKNWISGTKYDKVNWLLSGTVPSHLRIIGNFEDV